MFTSSQLRRLQPTGPLRLVALGCMVLVGLLSAAAVSPAIHSALHRFQPGQSEHAEPKGPAGTEAESGHFCAVTLFDHGLESGFAPVLALGTLEPLIAEAIALADQVARAVRAAQLPPGCGPPVC